MKLNRTIKWISLSIVALVLIVAATHLVWVLRERHEFESRLDKLRSDGDPVYMTDLATPEIPDSANVAVGVEDALRWLDAHEARDHNKEAVRLLGGQSSTGADLTAKESEVVQAYFESLRPLFRLLEGALRRPQCRFEIEFDRGGRHRALILAVAPSRSAACAVDSTRFAR